MKIFGKCTILCLALVGQMLMAQAPTNSISRYGNAQLVQPGVNQLFALANQERTARGLRPLRWDPALAAAALRHCQRMAAEGPISHRYRGEADLTDRAAAAGAHFSVIEENVAVGPYAPGIHQGWMNSPEHRANLLSPDIDRVGIAIVSARGEIYAVADYSRAVTVLTQAQVESRIADMLRANGLRVVSDPREARALCASSGQLMRTGSAQFAMRWEDPDLSKLPPELSRKVQSGDFRRAAVGSCTPEDAGSFTSYRIAVLLYAGDAAMPQQRH
jgi:Cysteine-rich secretory protein family